MRKNSFIFIILVVICTILCSCGVDLSSGCVVGYRKPFEQAAYEYFYDSNTINGYSCSLNNGLDSATCHISFEENLGDGYTGGSIYTYDFYDFDFEIQDGQLIPQSCHLLVHLFNEYGYVNSLDLDYTRAEVEQIVYDIYHKLTY